MTRNFEAVYENGVFRPLQPVDLAGHGKFFLRIVGPIEEDDDDPVDHEYMARCAAEAEENPPTIEEVREALSVIKGSLADDILAMRGPK